MLLHFYAALQVPLRAIIYFENKTTRFSVQPMNELRLGGFNEAIRNAEASRMSDTRTAHLNRGTRLEREFMEAFSRASSARASGRKSSVTPARNREREEAKQKTTTRYVTIHFNRACCAKDLRRTKVGRAVRVKRRRLSFVTFDAIDVKYSRPLPLPLNSQLSARK